MSNMHDHILDVIASLKDQLADKLSLANGDDDSIFAYDAKMLEDAISYLKDMLDVEGRITIHFSGVDITLLARRSPDEADS